MSFHRKFDMNVTYGKFGFAQFLVFGWMCLAFLYGLFAQGSNRFVTTVYFLDVFLFSAEGGGEKKFVKRLKWIALRIILGEYYGVNARFIQAKYSKCEMFGQQQ